MHPWLQRLVPLDKVSAGHIPYCTIHAFKGLERHAVIITDISDIEEAEEARSLLYIGMTRGTDFVTVLASEEVRDQLRQRYSELEAIGELSG